MKTLIKNGKIIKKDNHCVPAAIWIEEGIIRGSVQHFPKQILTKSSMPKSN